jgi:hypothetical protein
MTSFANDDEVLRFLGSAFRSPHSRVNVEASVFRLSLAVLAFVAVTREEESFAVFVAVVWPLLVEGILLQNLRVLQRGWVEGSGFMNHPGDRMDRAGEAYFPVESVELRTHRW